MKTVTEIQNEIEKNANIRCFNTFIKYIDNAFKSAERKADVDIAIIKIKIPYKAPEFSLVFTEMKKTETERREKEYACEDLITNDFSNKEFLKQIKKCKK